MKRIFIIYIVILTLWVPGMAQVGDSLSQKKEDSLFSGILLDIVVSGTLRPVRRMESPVAVEVYTTQFLRLNPVPSVFEAMQGVNGVRPQLNCNICNTGDIHINGLEGPYTMVTIDGMPIVSSLSSVYGLFGIPNQLIERIEIVKGPASGLYGSEAVGGLINIITKEPQKAPRLTADVMTTSWLENLVDAGVKWRAGKKANAILGVNFFSYQHPKDKNSDGFTDMALQQRISIFNKWSWKRNENRQANIAARYFYEDRWGGEMNWNKLYRGSDQVYGESIYTNRLELIGNYQLPVQEKIIFSGSYNYHHQDSWYGKTPYLGIQHIGFGQLTWYKTLQNHEWLTGLALRYNAYDDNSSATFDVTNGTNNPSKTLLPGIFVQDEIRISDMHTLLAGLRYDHHPLHGSIITPRFAWKWKTGKEGVFRLNAGTGFRVVNLFTEEHAALTGSRTVVIAEELQPEKSCNINLNYSYRIPFSNGFIVLDGSSWYTLFTNQILPDYDSNPDEILYKNLNGHAVSKGVSVSAEWNIKNRFRSQAGFTFQDIRQIRETTDGKKEVFKPTLTETWSGVWSMSYRLPNKGWSFDYTGNIYGPMRLPLLGSLDPRKSNSPIWSIQNVQVSKKIGQNMELYGGVKNLLHWTPNRGNPFIIARANDPFDKLVEYDSNGKILQTTENPYALSFDPTYVYGPNQGRRVFLGFRFTVF